MVSNCVLLLAVAVACCRYNTLLTLDPKIRCKTCTGRPSSVTLPRTLIPELCQKFCGEIFGTNLKTGIFPTLKNTLQAPLCTQVQQF